MYRTKAEDTALPHLPSHIKAVRARLYSGLSPIKPGMSKQSGCNSGLVCRKKNGRVKNKSKQLQRECKCWVTEGFHHRTDLISNAEHIFLGHHPDPRGGRWGVTGMQKTECFNHLACCDNLQLSESCQLVTTFPPHPCPQTKTNLEKHTDQPHSVLWQGHCVNSGTKPQLWQKSQLSFCCIAGIRPERQVRVCPPSPSRSLSGFKEIHLQAKLLLHLSLPSPVILSSSLTLFLY